MDVLEVTYRCTRLDYLRHLWRQRKRALLVFVALLVVVSVVVLVFVQAVSRPGGIALWMMLGGLPLFYVLVFVLSVFRTVRAIGRYPQLYPPEPWTLRVHAAGVDVSAGSLRHELPWSALTDVRLGGRDLLLVHRSGSLPVPRREVDDVEALYRALREGVDGATDEGGVEPPDDADGRVAYTLAESHWVEAYQVLERSRPRLLLWLAVGLLTASLAAVTALIVSRILADVLAGGQPGADDLLVVVLGAALCVAMPAWILARPWMRNRRLRKRIHTGELHLGEAWLAWTDEGVWLTTRSATRIPWGTLEGVVRSEGLACLKLGPYVVVPVPLEALGADADALIEHWRLRIRDARSAARPAAAGASTGAHPFAPPR